MIYDITKPVSPTMPKLGKGTECYKLMLSQTSLDMHEPLLPMLSPVIGTKISNAEFQYPSGQWLEMCGQQAALIANSAANKGQLGLLVEACNRDFRAEDAEELKNYLQYQKAYKKQSQSNERPEEVFPLLRFLPADCTKAGYLKAQMACQDRGDLTAYIDLKEIEQLDNLCGSHKQVTQMLRLMWDREVYNALRATVDGVSGSALLRTNLTVSTTPVRARQFFQKNLFDGTLGRMVFSCKPRGNRDGKIPRIGKFSDEFYEKLDEYLARLDNCKGRYVIKPLNKLIERMALEIAELGDLTDNDCLWDMGKRSLISAWKAGCVMWALNNMTYTRSMGEVIEWLVWHDMWSKYQVLGDMLKEGDTSRDEASKAAPGNMLDDIKGDSFTEQQLEALRTSMGKSKDGTKRQLRVWVYRGLITFNAETGLYTKTEEYLNRSR
ncbi:MAG: hypothetical protein K6E15_09675 [Prevotella sp.]|nr:hypothetical protein [Prevotella sp.]